MHFSLLGPMRLESGGTTLDLGGGKQQTVLTALLVAKCNVVSNDRLVDLLWEGNPPTKPYVTVRSYISNLRKLLEPGRGRGDRARVLLTRSPGYALDVDPESVDMFDFELRVGEATSMMRAKRAEAALETIMGALSLWRSDDLQDSPLVTFHGEVRRLLELRHQAVALRYDASLELGLHLDVIADLRHLVEAEPLRERSRAQLMLALYRAGRQAEAIEVHQAGLRAAIEQTGLDPSPTLASLEQRILNDDPDLAWRPNVSEGIVVVETAAEQPAPIGREDESSAALAALAQSTGSLIAISGEPGIGKTTFLEYVAEHGGRAGRTVLWGRGHNGAHTIPLAPWQGLLADMFDTLDDEELLDLVGRRAAELAQLVPEVGELAGVEPTDWRDSLALFDTISRVLRSYVTQHPTVLCLDDLHWADPASIRLLTYVVASLRELPVLIVAGWRDTEARSDELAAALTELGSQAGANRFEFSGLDVHGVRDLWVDLGADDPDRRSAESLRKRTGGNPLFITELLRSGSAGGAGSPLPSVNPSVTVHDTIAARIAGLPEACRELLGIASLCPGGFSDDLLKELSGFDEDTLLASLEAALSARIIMEDPGSTKLFVFCHALIGESLSSRMSDVRKARLHTRIATVLARQQMPSGQVAHLFLQGVTVGEPITAAGSALTAARTSARLHDHQGAIDLIERGLTALDRTDDDHLRAELLIELAQRRKHLQHYAQSHAAASEAFARAKRGGDIDLMVNAALVFCGQGPDEAQQGLQWLGYWNPPGPALEMLEDCLEKLPTGPLRATVLLAFASQLFGEFHQPELVKSTLDEAVAEARVSQSRELLSAALHYRSLTLDRQLGIDERRELIHESLALAVEGGLTHRELVSRRDLLVLALDDGDMAGAREQAAIAASITRRLDDWMQRMLAESMSISLDLLQGDFDKAEVDLADAMGRFERLGSAALDVFGIQYAVLQRERGHLAEVEAMMSWKLSGYPGPAYGVALALVMAEQGRHEEAMAVVSEFGNSSLITGGEAVLQFMTPGFYSEIVVLAQDRDRAEPLYAELVGAAGRMVAMVSGIALFGSLSLPLGRLACLLGRYEEAEAHLDEAERRHEAVSARPYQLRTTVARAELAAARGRSEEASGLLTEGRALADELAMGWLIDGAEARLSPPPRPSA